MTILTNKMLEAQYATWDNLHGYFPCNELNSEPISEVSGDVTVASNVVARTIDNGIDLSFASGAPTSGSVGYNIDISKGIAFIVHSQISGLSAFNAVILGDSATTNILKLSPVASTVRLGSEVLPISNLNGSAVNDGEDCLVAWVFDAKTKTQYLYQSINGAEISMEDSGVVTDTRLQNVVLTNKIALHAPGFEQPTYGFALLQFNSIPSDLVAGLQEIEKQWKANRSFLPDSWKNA